MRPPRGEFRQRLVAVASKSAAGEVEVIVLIAYRDQAELRQARVWVDDNTIVEPQVGRCSQPVLQRTRPREGARRCWMRESDSNNSYDLSGPTKTISALG